MSADSSSRVSSNVFGPTWITIGLAIMIVGAFYPDAPMVTAIGFVALGATDVIVLRRHEPSSVLPTVLLHGITYALLYALFIGARLHSPASAAASPLTLLTALDLAASMLPMAIALRRLLACLRTATLSQP
jgi:hypothetical protein